MELLFGIGLPVFRRPHRSRKYFLTSFAVVEAKGIASSKKVYASVTVLNSNGQKVGKEVKTATVKGTVNPTWGSTFVLYAQSPKFLSLYLKFAQLHFLKCAALRCNGWKMDFSFCRICCRRILFLGVLKCVKRVIITIYQTHVVPFVQHRRRGVCGHVSPSLRKAHFTRCRSLHWCSDHSSHE
jgi:hypothetical protein